MPLLPGITRLRVSSVLCLGIRSYYRYMSPDIMPNLEEPKVKCVDGKSYVCWRCSNETRIPSKYIKTIFLAFHVERLDPLKPGRKYDCDRLDCM